MRPSDNFWSFLGYLPNLWENVQKLFGGLDENFGKPSEIFRKSPQTSLCIVNILYNKKEITWPFRDMKFILLR